MNKDIGSLLNNWEYAPGELKVRKVVGADGRDKIQIRMDLGLMQLEWTGRPDAQKPHGCESLLNFYQTKEVDWEGPRTGDAFRLSRQDCWALAQEAMQYYWRRISFFELKEYEGAESDADHNLAILDLCNRYAEHDEDRQMAEQYSVFVTAHRFQARALAQLEHEDYQSGLTEIRAGIERVEALLAEQGKLDYAAECPELLFLKEWEGEVERSRPLSQVEQLQADLQMAVEQENFERAATLRDRLQSIEAGSSAAAESS